MFVIFIIVVSVAQVTWDAGAREEGQGCRPLSDQAVYVFVFVFVVVCRLFACFFVQVCICVFVRLFVCCFFV